MGSQRPADVEAVAPRQEEIEDDQFVRLGRSQLEPRLSVGGDLHRVPFFLEPAPENFPDLLLILDNQQGHDRAVLL